MYRSDVRRNAIALIERGFSLRSISISTGINRTTLREWRENPERSVLERRTCPRCAAVPNFPEPDDDYAYLLGLYLGDGCISRASARDKDVWKLRIMCADAWPGLIGECERAVRSIRPGNKVGIAHMVGCHFARGLFHSDGYRGINRVRALRMRGDQWYEYPRYLFTNESADILRLCGETLDQLGVAWRFSRRNAISVARREAVARLDEFVGPKY